MPKPPPYMLTDDKPSLILRAAHRLFLQDGFSVTSMDAITQAAGVSKATVYAHFESKEKLFETLIRLGSEAALSSIPALERSGGDPRTELLAFFGPFLKLLFGPEGSGWSRLVIAEAHRHPQMALFFYQCTIERITKSVESYLQQLATDGLFPPQDGRLSAEALVGMVLLGPHHRALLVGPDSIQIERNLEFGINLLLARSTASA